MCYVKCFRIDDVRIAELIAWLVCYQIPLSSIVFVAGKVNGIETWEFSLKSQTFTRSKLLAVLAFLRRFDGGGGQRPGDQVRLNSIMVRWIARDIIIVIHWWYRRSIDRSLIGNARNFVFREDKTVGSCWRRKVLRLTRIVVDVNLN